MGKHLAVYYRVSTFCQWVFKRCHSQVQSSQVPLTFKILKKGWSEKNTLPVNTDVMYECSTERHDSLTSIKTLFSFVTCLNPRLPWWLLVSLLMFSHTCLNLTVYRFCSYLRQLKSEGELVIY